MPAAFATRCARCPSWRPYCGAVFTTVRDAGGADYALRRAVDDGLIDGPRLFIAGKALCRKRAATAISVNAST